MVLFENVLRTWYEFGLLDVIIPFILVFTIVYAILQKTMILGSTKDQRPKNNINAMVAFVLGFIVVATLQIVNVITIMAQYFALASIAIMLVVVIAALLGVKDWEKTKFPLIICSVITIIITIYALGFGKNISLRFFDARIVPVILGLLFILGIIYYITRSPKPKTAAKKPENKKAEIKKPEDDKNKKIRDEVVKRLIDAGVVKKRSYTESEKDEIFNEFNKQRAMHLGRHN